MAKVYGQQVKFTPYLAPEGGLRELVDYLRRSFRRAKSLLLVGHEPNLTTFISVLVTGREGADIRLKKGGLVKMDIDTLQFGRCARLDWLLTPRQLRG